jgi:hypothetical protein
VDHRDFNGAPTPDILFIAGTLISPITVCENKVVTFLDEVPAAISITIFITGLFADVSEIVYRESGWRIVEEEDADVMMMASDSPGVGIDGLQSGASNKLAENMCIQEIQTVFEELLAATTYYHEQCVLDELVLSFFARDWISVVSGTTLVHYPSRFMRIYMFLAPNSNYVTKPQVWEPP